MRIRDCKSCEWMVGDNIEMLKVTLESTDDVIIMFVPEQHARNCSGNGSRRHPAIFLEAPAPPQNVVGYSSITVFLDICDLAS